MAQTPLTSATSYASAQDVLNRYDYRTVGQLLNDDDSRNGLSVSEILIDTKLAALLLESSGDFESACVRGRRYLPTDIAAMISNGGAGAQWIVGIICGLAIGKVWDRRFDREKMPPAVTNAYTKLEQLADGERIIPTSESATAGETVPTIQPPLPMGDLVIERARSYFGPLWRIQRNGG